MSGSRQERQYALFYARVLETRHNGKERKEDTAARSGGRDYLPATLLSPMALLLLLLLGFTFSLALVPSR